MKNLFFLVLIPLVLSGCTSTFEFKIDDVNQEDEFVFGIGVTPSKISLHISGEIESGSAIIKLRREDNTRVESFRLLNGIVDTSYTSEWYSEKNKIIYLPEGVKSGNLKIRISLG